MGSVWARVPGTGGGPTLAVVGHIDEIGLIVTHIEDTASCASSASAAGTRRSSSASASSVGTQEGAVPGVIGKKPIHLL